MRMAGKGETESKLSEEKIAVFKDFFQNKTIIRPYNFFVSILNDRINLHPVESIPEIKHYHILNIAIPTYSFEVINQPNGNLSRSFPVLKSEPINIKIDFEEDENLTIRKFIDWCQSRIISQNGIHLNPGKNKIPIILVEIVGVQGNRIMDINFRNCYYGSSEGASFDYKGNESIKYGIIFGCDFYDTVYYN